MVTFKCWKISSIGDGFGAHTGSLCSFHAKSSIGGSIDNVAGAHHWFLALLEAYWMLHQILRSTKCEQA